MLGALLPGDPLFAFSAKEKHSLSNFFGVIAVGVACCAQPTHCHGNQQALSLGRVPSPCGTEGSREMLAVERAGEVHGKAAVLRVRGR